MERGGKSNGGKPKRLDGFVYYPEGNVPNLVPLSQEEASKLGDGYYAGTEGIAAQYAFINGEGVVIRMTYENAVRNGIILLVPPPKTVTMRDWALTNRTDGNGTH